MSVRTDYRHIGSNAENDQLIQAKLIQELSPDEFYADSTHLLIDEDAARRLNELKAKVNEKTVAKWVGKTRFLFYDYSVGRKISISKAKLINHHSNSPVYAINKKHLTQIKVTELARGILISLSETHSFREVCRFLQLKEDFLYHLEKGRVKNISIEDAVDIEQHFNIKIFYPDLIFKIACEEDIIGKKRKNKEAIASEDVDTPLLKKQRLNPIEKQSEMSNCTNGRSEIILAIIGLVTVKNSNNTTQVIKNDYKDETSVFEVDAFRDPGFSSPLDYLINPYLPTPITETENL